MIPMCESHIQLSLFGRHRSAALIMLPNYTPVGWYESDLWVVTNSMYTVEYEIKVSHADFVADFKKEAKHRRLATTQGANCRPTRFFYACPTGVIAPEEVPSYAGLVLFSWPHNRWTTAPPRATFVRQAPRLGSSKFDDSEVRTMRRSSYYRYWNERSARQESSDERRIWQARRAQQETLAKEEAQ